MSVLARARVNKAKIFAWNGGETCVFPNASQCSTDWYQPPACTQTVNCAWEHSDIHVVCFFLWWPWHPLGANGPVFLFANISEIILAVRGMNMISCQMHESRWRMKIFSDYDWVTCNRIQMQLILDGYESAEISNWKWCCPGSCIQFWRGNW